MKQGRPLTQEEAAAKEEYAYSVAVQAYLFTFPLTMTERERKLRLTFEAPRPDEPVAPINQLGHIRKLATAKGSAYTGVLVELKDQPMILHVPDILDRFFTVEVADAYTTNIPYVVGTPRQRRQRWQLRVCRPQLEGRAFGWR